MRWYYRNVIRLKRCSECGKRTDLTKFTTLKPSGAFWMCKECLSDIEAETKAQQKEDLKEYWDMVARGING